MFVGGGNQPASRAVAPVLSVTRRSKERDGDAEICGYGLPREPRLFEFGTGRSAFPRELVFMPQTGPSSAALWLPRRSTGCGLGKLQAPLSTSARGR
jgi:hypothetical protein